MTRYKPYSRRRLNHLLRAWVARNAALLARILAGALVLVGVETALIASLDLPYGSYLMGVAHAAIVAATTAIMLGAFVTHEPEAISQLRGAWGEDNTRDLLAAARRRRMIWGWVDTIDLAVGDIDHLVVTRSGGVVAIDSKWRSRLDDDNVAELVKSALAVKRRGQGVLLTQLGRTRGSHRGRVNPLEVRPLVVVWGKGQSELSESTSAQGVDLIPGSSLLGWLRRLEGNPVDRAFAREVLRKVEEFRESARAGLDLEARSRSNQTS